MREICEPTTCRYESVSAPWASDGAAPTRGRRGGRAPEGERMFRRLAEEGAAATRESLANAGPLDLVEESRRAFADFAPDIAGAAVFLDDGAAETAHYACGASFMLGLGARNVFALPAASAATTTERVPDDVTNGTTLKEKMCESSNDREPPNDHRLDSLVDVAGAPLPKDTCLVIFTHRLLKTVAPDVLELVKQRPETAKVLVAAAATAEAHEADARAAARNAGASVLAANEIARDAKAKQEQEMRMAVSVVLQSHSKSVRDARGKNNNAPSATTADASLSKKTLGSDAFAAADWGDWGSEEDEETSAFTVSHDVTETNAAVSSAREDSFRAEDEDIGANSLESRFAITYFPSPFVPLSDGAFVLPVDSAGATASLRRLTETISTETPEKKRRSSLCPSFEDGTEEDGGEFPAPAGVGVLAATLAQIGFSSLGFSRFECFAIGRVARAVARAVSIAGPPSESHASLRHDNRPCALLLVDRVADVMTPALDEAFVGDDDDAFLAAKERVGKRREIVDFHDETKKEKAGFFARADATFSLSFEPTLRAVAWAHPNDTEARRFADASTRRSLTQTAVAARRWVADAAREEGVVFEELLTKNANAKSVSASELRSMLKPFLDDPRLRMRRGAMTHAVLIVAECLEDREESLRAKSLSKEDASYASDSPAPYACSFAAAAREMTRDAARAVAARAGEGAAAAAVANSLRKTLNCATSIVAKETTSSNDERPPLSLKTAAVLFIAAYALAGEAAAFERRFLGLGRVDFSCLEEEASDEEEDRDSLNDELRRVTRDAARNASLNSPFGRGDETLLRDALADFVIEASASKTVFSSSSPDSLKHFTDEKEKEKEKEERRKRSLAKALDWLGNDLAFRLVEREARGGFDRDVDSSEDDFEKKALLLETRDGVERFANRLGDVARARRRYASCGGLVDFAEASAFGVNDANARHHHRSLLKQLAERVSVGADGGESAFRGDDVNTGSHETPFVDAAHVASSLGGFLKSGVGGVLGSLGLKGPTLVAAPKPSDSPTVLIFVLGGITAREIRDVRAAAADVIGRTFADAESGAKVEDIIVGGTGLLRASGEDLVGMVA